MDALFRKNKSTARHDWTNTGSFINRPVHGWLHGDEQLAPDAGICYTLRVCIAKNTWLLMIPVFYFIWLYHNMLYNV